MKVIKKELVCDEEDIDWVQTEKHVFETASNHPFLVGLHSCFQTPSGSVHAFIYFTIMKMKIHRLLETTTLIVSRFVKRKYSTGLLISLIET